MAPKAGRNGKLLSKHCAKDFRKRVKRLNEIALHSENPNAVISACVVLDERWLGKVPQAATGGDGGPVQLIVNCGVATPENWGKWEENGKSRRLKSRLRPLRLRPSRQRRNKIIETNIEQPTISIGWAVSQPRV